MSMDKNFIGQRRHPGWARRLIAELSVFGEPAALALGRFGVLVQKVANTLRGICRGSAAGAGLSSSEKIWMLGWLVCGAVVWGLVRSMLSNSGVEHEGLTQAIPVAVSVAFMLIFAYPALRSIGSPDRLMWLLGVSVTVGLLPRVPLMPYAREGVHLVLLAGAVCMVCRRVRLGEAIRASLPLRLYFVYLGICVISILVSQLTGVAKVWELKVGVAELILYGAFGLVIAGLAMDRVPTLKSPVVLLLDGFAWAAIVQLAVASIAIALAIGSPLVPGNDTLLGLGYWDRVKVTFPGPDQAGVFFAASIPLLIWWASRQRERRTRMAAMIYLQMAPWFLIASGSRTGRIAALVVVGACLLRRSFRPWMLKLLPSLLAAFMIGFFYQSFPSALNDLLHAGPLSGMNLRGHFFQDAERWRLISESWEFFSAAPFWRQLFGFGVGVGGYRLADYPSAHNFFDLVIETGLVGTAAVAAFVVVIVSRLARIAHLAANGEQHPDMAFAILIGLIAVTIGGATYEVQTWGFVMVIYAMAISITRDGSLGQMPDIDSADLQRQVKLPG